MATATTLTIPSTPSHLPPISAVIHLSALAYNLAEVRRCVQPACEILAVVKADAYGHGAVPISRALGKLHIRRYGVSTVQEGIALREGGIDHSILIMGGISPAQLPELIHYRLTPVLSDQETGCRLAEYVSSRPTPFPIHVKVETGMKRLGLSVEEIIPFLQSGILNGPLQLEGLMTHLADADDPDPGFTQVQLDRFRSVVNQLQEAGMAVPTLHVANSAGVLCHPSAHLGMVRPGLMLYGYTSAACSVKLQPVMSITTKVVHVRTVQTGEYLGYNRSYRTVRPSRIAVLPVGYAHGFHRRLSDRAMVLIGGYRAPIVGKICMDMMFVDATGLPSIDSGDEVVLLGRQGKETISADDLANWQDTIPYEVLCDVGPRVNRVYEPLK